MKRVRTQQKQILHLDPRVEMPKSKVDSTEAILSLLKTLKGEKKIVVGINSVSRAIIQKKIEYVVFSGEINPRELVQHILIMAGNSKIPVIPTDISSDEIGQALGLRRACVVGLIGGCPSDVADALTPFCSQVDISGLPFVRVETDVFEKV